MKTPKNHFKFRKTLEWLVWPGFWDWVRGEFRLGIDKMLGLIDS